jgi:hypothetical protein
LLSTKQNKRILRAIVLGLLMVALLGPWVFDIIHIPGEFPCSDPWIRVGGDFCGLPVPGIYSVLGFIGIFFLLPVISTTALLLRNDGRPWFMFHILALIMGMGLLLMSGLLRYPRLSWGAWGVWLYMVAAAGALILEVILLAARRSFSQPEGRA